MTETAKPPSAADDARAAKRFNQLPIGVRKMLAELGDDDVTTLKNVIELFRDLHGWCRISKWLLIGSISMAIFLAQGINAIRDVIATALRALGKN